MGALKHAGIVLALLAVFLGLPVLLGGDLERFSPAQEADAVSSASVALPEQPSGRYVVLLNRTLHPDTAEQWRAFFLEQPVDVIMEDLSCLVVDYDAAALQLAERYQARLAEHQMTVRTENDLLTVSKAETGLFDAVILSAELAEAYALVPSEEVLVIQIGEAA